MIALSPFDEGPRPGLDPGLGLCPGPRDGTAPALAALLESSTLEPWRTGKYVNWIPPAQDPISQLPVMRYEGARSRDDSRGLGPPLDI